MHCVEWREDTGDGYEEGGGVTLYHCRMLSQHTHQQLQTSLNHHHLMMHHAKQTHHVTVM